MSLRLFAFGHGQRVYTQNAVCALHRGLVAYSTTVNLLCMHIFGACTYLGINAFSQWNVFKLETLNYNSHFEPLQHAPHCGHMQASCLSLSLHSPFTFTIQFVFFFSANLLVCYCEFVHGNNALQFAPLHYCVNANVL